MAITKTFLVMFASVLLAFLSGAHGQTETCTGRGIEGIADGNSCCPLACGQCGGSGCGLQDSGSSEFSGSQACCSSGVPELDRPCSEFEPPCTGDDDTADGGDGSTDSDDDGAACDGKVSKDGNICCSSECSACGGGRCKMNYPGKGRRAGRANCCPRKIRKSGDYCGEDGEGAPCIIPSGVTEVTNWAYNNGN